MPVKRAWRGTGGGGCGVSLSAIQPGRGTGRRGVADLVQVAADLAPGGDDVAAAGADVDQGSEAAGGVRDRVSRCPEVQVPAAGRGRHGECRPGTRLACLGAEPGQRHDAARLAGFLGDVQVHHDQAGRAARQADVVRPGRPPRADPGRVDGGVVLPVAAQGRLLAADGARKHVPAAGRHRERGLEEAILVPVHRGCRPGREWRMALFAAGVARTFSLAAIMRHPGCRGLAAAPPLLVEEGAALPLIEAAPDAELLPGGEGVVKALALDRAARADALGLAGPGIALLPGEEQVRIGERACRVPHPGLGARGRAVAVRARAPAARGRGGL